MSPELSSWTSKKAVEMGPGAIVADLLDRLGFGALAVDLLDEFGFVALVMSLLDDLVDVVMLIDLLNSPDVSPSIHPPLEHLSPAGTFDCESAVSGWARRPSSFLLTFSTSTPRRRRSLAVSPVTGTRNIANAI